MNEGPNGHGYKFTRFVTCLEYPAYLWAALANGVRKQAAIFCDIPSVTSFEHSKYVSVTEQRRGGGRGTHNDNSEM